MRSADLLETPELNYEQWRDLLRPNFGLHRVDDPKAFAGRVRSRHILGLNASEIRNSKCHCERTQRDIRLDGVDHCFAVFQVAGPGEWSVMPRCESLRSAEPLRRKRGDID